MILRLSTLPYDLEKVPKQQKKVSKHQAGEYWAGKITTPIFVLFLYLFFFFCTHFNTNKKYMLSYYKFKLKQ